MAPPTAAPACASGRVSQRAHPKINQALERNQRLATALGVNGTPAYLIGEQFIPGAIDSASLAKVISEERAKLVNITLAKKTAESERGQRR